MFDFGFWKSEIFLRFRYFRFRYLRFPKAKIDKISDFSILENENIFWIFSNLLKMKFDNIFFGYSRNLNLHHVIQSPAMNSACQWRYFDCSDFNFNRFSLIMSETFPGLLFGGNGSKIKKFGDMYTIFFDQSFSLLSIVVWAIFF